MTQLLHNIRSIAFIESRLLQNITLIHGVGVMLNYWRNFQTLPVVGLANYEVTSKTENKSTLFSHTVTALLSAHFSPGGKRLSFLLTCVNGDRFLVGGNGRPFPVVQTSDILPGKVTTPSGCNLSVQYTDTLGLLPVLD